MQHTHTHTHTHSISMGRMSITSSLIFSLLQAYRTAKGPSVVASVAKWPIMLQSKTRVFFFLTHPIRRPPGSFPSAPCFITFPLSHSPTHEHGMQTHTRSARFGLLIPSNIHKKAWQPRCLSILDKPSEASFLLSFWLTFPSSVLLTNPALTICGQVTWNFSIQVNMQTWEIQETSKWRRYSRGQTIFISSSEETNEKDKVYFAPIIWYSQMERFPPILCLSRRNKKAF